MMQISVFVWIGLGVIGVLGLVFLFYLLNSVRNARLQAEQRKVLSAGDKARARDYEQARKDLNEFRKSIRSRFNKRVEIIDLICDLGDQWEDRAAPRYISFEQARLAQQQIEPLLALPVSRKMPTLVILLHTLGGYSQSSQLIASAIHRYPGPKIAYVPYIAMSGGTKIALACEKIVMGNAACIGPIDTQFNGVSNRSLQRLVTDERAGALPAGVLLTLYEAEKFDAFAVQHAEATTHDNHKRSGKHENVAGFLASGEWAHGRSIFLKDAVDELGLNASAPLPADIQGYVDARIRMIDTQIEQEAKGRSPSDKSGDGASSESGLLLKSHVIA
jgi:ATP-dependent protease ClpP protease subunit